MGTIASNGANNTIYDDGTVEEDETDPPNVSTEQPTKHGRRPSKHQKIEVAKNNLIHKAIECINKASSSGTSSELDGYELCGRYVDSKLHAINCQGGQSYKFKQFF